VLSRDSFIAVFVKPLWKWGGFFINKKQMFFTRDFVLMLLVGKFNPFAEAFYFKGFSAV
jgi:hypothetical protein